MLRARAVDARGVCVVRLPKKRGFAGALLAWSLQPRRALLGCLLRWPMKRSRAAVAPEARGQRGCLLFGRAFARMRGPAAPPPPPLCARASTAGAQFCVAQHKSNAAQCAWGVRRAGRPKRRGVSHPPPLSPKRKGCCWATRRPFFFEPATSPSLTLCAAQLALLAPNNTHTHTPLPLNKKTTTKTRRLRFPPS